MRKPNTRKPNFRKPPVSSLAKSMPHTTPQSKLQARSATPRPPRPRPQVNKPQIAKPPKSV